ncbi:hypothetical protein [Thermomonas sp.]|uniref:PepSY domain-containing protein n=1 Tax=Thermomonas sp. TaxID=1971895 RepID=UPI00248A549E|nr:hypothetical protein [Thermomonas sp.]MDI1254110.1 hypothetical protein [Thermomonas sp.]
MSRCQLPSLKLLTIAIWAMLPVLTAFAGPQSASQQDSRQDRGRSRDNTSLSDAVRRIERDTRGEVLSAERVQYDGRDMHRVKVVDDEGRVRVFMQDPNRRNDNNADPNRAGSNRNDGQDDSHGSRGRPRPTRDNDD